LDGVNFFVAAMQAGFGVFVTVHLVRNGWAAQAIGFALTLSTVTSLCSQMPAGALIDGLRDKSRAAQAGIVGVGAAALLLALSPERPAVYLAQVLNGFSSAIFGVVMTVVAADLSRGTRRFNLTLGVLGVAISIGASLSTLLAGLIAAALGGTAAFLGLASFGLLGVLLLWIGLPETRPLTSSPIRT
jgi:MFS family permease